MSMHNSDLESASCQDGAPETLHTCARHRKHRSWELHGLIEQIVKHATEAIQRLSLSDLSSEPRSEDNRSATHDYKSKTTATVFGTNHKPVISTKEIHAFEKLFHHRLEKLGPREMYRRICEITNVHVRLNTLLMFVEKISPHKEQEHFDSAVNDALELASSHLCGEDKHRAFNRLAALKHPDPTWNSKINRFRL